MYWFCNWLTRTLLRMICDWHVVGLENLPREGPVLLMANHLYWLDPPILGMLLPRPIIFMAKEELWKNWFVRWVVVGYGAFAIRRGEMDRQALRQAIKVLAEGGVLGMFPEGTRSRNGKLQAGHPGVALLALRTGAPIVPVAIVGTNKIWHISGLIKRPRFSITIGEPFTLPSSAASGSKDLSRLSDVMMRRIAALLPVEMRGVYGEPAVGDREPVSGTSPT